MNQRTFLGLTHNPFTPPREGFFAGADRRTHLDHLRHLSLWSRRVLVVTGSFGIGKSSLFRELSGSLEPSTKAARLSGVVVSSEREALVGLLQGFGIAADLDAHVDDLAELIIHHANEQEALGRVCMVMADDAHLLDVQALQRLVGLVAGSSLRLLLFAEASLITNLNRAAKKHELEWFEIRLTGFPKSDVRDYLEWRFRQAHYRGLLPFTDEQLEKIILRSAGNPSVVDSIANRMLADMESGEIRNQGKGFPLMHASLAVLLVVMVGLVYLLVQDESPVELAGEDVPAPALTIWADEAASEAGLESEPPAAELDTGEQTLPVEQAQVDDAMDTDMADEQAGTDPAVSEDLVDAGLTSDESTAADASPFADTAVDMSDATAAIEIPEAVDAVQAQEDPVVAAVEELSPPVVAPLPEPEPEPEASSSTDEFHSAQWLLRQDPNSLTLQLLTLSSRERAAGFVNRQDNPGEFALYRMQRDDKLLYVITYGVFSTRDAAQAAAGGFDGEMAKLKPWIRPLRLVQDTIRGTLQD